MLPHVFYSFLVIKEYSSSLIKKDYELTLNIIYLELFNLLIQGHSQ